MQVNISNVSNATKTPSFVVELPPQLDYSFRIIFLTVHSAYFIIVIFCSQLRKLSLIHMHHTNMIGLLTGIHYCIWIAWTAPNTGNPVLNLVLCRISETFWALSKFARCFSILVLAIYRLIAVYRVHLFKRIVNSIKIYLIAIASVWFVSALVFFPSKYITNTVPGLIMCYDGYSTSFASSTAYFVVTSFLVCLLIVLFERICLPKY